MAFNVTGFDPFRFLSMGYIRDLVYQTKVQMWTNCVTELLHIVRLLQQ
jgi:hypothetical protein